MFVMTSIYQELQKIGLTPNQSLVYLTLFRSGEVKAGEIIKKTGLHRNLVYVALQELIDKKLISKSKSKRVSIYKTLTPTRLLANLQEKERVAKGVIEELGLISLKGNTQEITVYEGVDEFRRHVMRTYSMVKHGGVIRYLGISPEWHEIVGPVLEHEVEKIQVEKKIKIKALAKSLSQGDLLHLRKVKGLSQVKINPLISSDTSGIEILEDRISIRSFIEPYFVVEISHKQLAENYQNYFDFLWKRKISK